MKREINPEIKNIRQEAAKEIRMHRFRDETRKEIAGNDLSRNRGALEYVENLKGLINFFVYVRSLSFGKIKVLDLGAGSTRAAAELKSLDDITYNIDFKASSLKRDADVDKHLGKENLILTSAENLRGIKDGELAGIISSFSIGHSRAPKLVAQNVDRVLMPSGILKACYMDFPNDPTDEFTPKHEELIKALQGYKFDVAVNKYKATSINGTDGGYGVILVAIKPPVVGVKAATLLSEDWQDREKQVKLLEEKGFKPWEYEGNGRSDSEEMLIDAADIQAEVKEIRKLLS